MLDMKEEVNKSESPEDRKKEVGGRKSESPNDRKKEVGGQRSEVGSRKTEDRGQGLEGKDHSLTV
jgi:hypothetical protein